MLIFLLVNEKRSYSPFIKNLLHGFIMQSSQVARTLAWRWVVVVVGGVGGGVGGGRGGHSQTGVREERYHRAERFKESV